MRVVAIGMDPQVSQPVLLLQEIAGRHRVLPVWVGVPEATAIELERQRVITPRPTTHRLIGEVITSCGRQLERVRVTMMRDNVFHGELVLDGGTRISARVSDAVALALHLDVPIQAEDDVLDQVAVADAEVVTLDPGGEAEPLDLDPADRPPAEGGAIDVGEIAEFRRFLDDASPEDFDKG
ncbi:bifunctional nuclease family protein [Pseudonocardia nigra]|uniref:bifunctional nuclease family protein n=1 Tax=Pseudonocardia nigra TaxID=1921578 RepID=UPI001FE82BB3|nr:bifunctional nuclease family protein [Pseudonocardia nigra]